MTKSQQAWSNGSSSSPISSASTSLSSSFSSDMLPADSSQSDTDHSVSHNRHEALEPQRARSSSAAVVMGQTYSKPSASSSTTTAKGISLSATVAGVKLKRAFAARRKHSDDPSKSFPGSKRQQDRTGLGVADQPAEPTTPRTPRGPKLTLQMAAQVLAGGKKSARTPLSPVPPPPPPKPANMQGLKLIPPSIIPSEADNRTSIIAMSPGISSAVSFMRQGEEQREEQERRTATKENEGVKLDKDGDNAKEGWRKSDSTISHHTIRPIGSRTSRPVSVAESLQTICPPNRRSVFEDGVPEENESFKTVSEELPPISVRTSPTPSLRAKNRRSMSLNVTPVTAKSPPLSLTIPDLKHPSKSLTDAPVPPTLNPSISARETPTLTRASVSGVIAPSSAGLQSTGNNIRGRLAAWTATTGTSSPRSPLPPPLPPKSPASLRQTAMNMSNGLAPAAGLAKRAVEKMGRWGGFSSSSSTSGYSSSSSSTGPSSYDHGLNLKRTSSNQSGGKKNRRTPDAPSGAWSVASSVGSSSISDLESAQIGPTLGAMVRAPLINKAAGAGGIVFGRDLRSVTRTTGIGMGLSLEKRKESEKKGNDIFSLETRLVPALAVRCAQHLMIWGIQEEGLFRVSGRPTHVSKLRNEFDSGADFDMRECSPGELDPHAVASVFKAFLRELPEPILTRNLVPYFDEALVREHNSHPSPATTSPGRMGARGPGLPSGPKVGMAALRKPPSLSTLAMPSFVGVPPPSKAFLSALKSLISQLPPENRDLLRTVTELIKITAREYKQTKMPLSNLLLVFCPSLNMNPPLLKALCEAEGIWDPSEPLPSPGILDIKRESVLDISASVAGPSPTESGEDVDESADSTEQFLDARDGSEESLETPEAQTDEERQSFDSHLGIARSRPRGPRRAAVPAAIFPADSDFTNAQEDSSSERSPWNQSSPPPLSSSAESLNSSAASSAEPSLVHLPLEPDHLSKSGRTSSPGIADPNDFSLPPTRKEYISGPILFPTSESVPSTPHLSPRRSIPLLSLPASSTITSTSAPATPRLRLKKPSISLFTKRSSPSLASNKSLISSPYLVSAPSSDSSVSTPISAVTASQSTPFIDTLVVSSPLRMGFDLDLDVVPPSLIPPPAEEPKTTIEVSEEPLSAPSSPYELGTTPIADRYRSESNASLLSPDSGGARLRPKPARQASQASLVSVASSHLDLEEDEGADEWTRSVLIAADVQPS
ncbi:hypothetical protein C8J56DRAFT_927093 [Mycena floridula]|nr:hypothetical protein C8J56DRAFT_927093 [Mycena floridula]